MMGIAFRSLKGNGDEPAYDPAENHPWENGPIQQAAVDAAEIAARQRLEEARAIEMRRREVFGARVDDIMGLFQLVLSVTSLPGIRRAQARVEELRGRLLNEVYNGPLPAPEAPGPDDDAAPPEPRTPEVEAALTEELASSLEASRVLAPLPVSPEMRLRRDLAEEMAWTEARAAVEALDPVPLLPPDLRYGGPEPQQTEAKLAARSTERDRAIGEIAYRLMPQWDRGTDPPDVPPPLTKEQAEVLDRHLRAAEEPADPSLGPLTRMELWERRYARAVGAAFKEITGRTGPLKVDQVTGQTR